MTAHAVPAKLIAAARDALKHRRFTPELFRALDSLDPDALRSDPWLALAQGRRLCRIHSRFAAATPLIDHALAAFRAQEDSEGEEWALAEWVVMRYHNDAFVEALDGVAPVLDRALQPYLRAEFHFGRFLGLIGLERIREAVEAGEAALEALAEERDPWLQRIGRIQLLRNIAAGYHYIGQSRKSIEAASSAVQLALADDETADMRPWCFYELGLALWRQGELSASTTALDEARRLAETWQHEQLWRWAVAAQGHVLRDQDRLDAALAAYQLAGCWAEDPEGPAFIQLRQGRLAEARWSCEMCLALANTGRGRYSIADAQTLLALVDLASGQPASALGLLNESVARYAASHLAYNVASAHLYRAAAALALGQHPVVDEALAEFLRFAGREGVLTCSWWIPELIAPLLIYALQHGIEAPAATRILEQRFARDLGASADLGSSHPAAELEIARRVQLSLLPEVPPVMPDLDIAATVLPAVEVGGDFVGYFPKGALPEAGVRRQLGIAVGDISGKGLAAALLLSGTVVALNTVAANGAPPSEVAAALHASLRPYTSRSQMNIAFCYTLLDQEPHGWSLRAVGAGAIAPLIRRANGALLWLDTAGFPLGTMVAQQYLEQRATLAPGDVLLLLSDGIVEAMNAERHLFGFDRLSEVVAGLGDKRDAHSMLTEIMSAVQTHSSGAEQQDDITLVVVRVLAGGREA